MNIDFKAHNSSINYLDSLKEIIALTWPQLLMMLAQFLVALADIVVAGHINKEVQASLGLISISIFFFLIIATAISSGAVAIISQSLGAGQRKRVERYTSLLFILAISFGIFFTIVFSVAKNAFLQILNVPESILPITAYFLSVYLYVLPAYYLLLSTNAIFQAYKKVKFPLYSMCLITSLNGILDFGLGLGLWGFPYLGYRGVAWATFCSVTLGAICNVHNMYRTGLLVFPLFPPLRWIRIAWRCLYNYAWPTAMTQILWQGSYIILYIIIGYLPVEHVGPLAGFAAGMRIESILLMPAFALNLTASILIGQTLGKGQHDKAQKIALNILGVGTAVITLAALCLWNFRVPILDFIAPDAIVQKNTLSYLSYVLPATPFTVGAMILGGIMNGAGATFYTMISFGITAWFIRIPLAYFSCQIIWLNSEGIWFSILVSHVCHCLCLLFIFQFMNWRKFAMRTPR